MKSNILTLFPTSAERHTPPAATRNTSSLSALAERLERPASNVETLPSIESVILQKLLAEIDARQVTRAQPTYVIDQAPAPRNDNLQRTLWGSLWALSIVVSVLTVKYIDAQTMAPRADNPESRSIDKLTATITTQSHAFSTVSDSLQQLAHAIASSAQRTAAIPDMLDRLGSNLQQIRLPAVKQAAAVVTTSSEPAPRPAPPPVIIGSSPQPADAPIPMGGHIHPPIEWAVAPANVVVHHNSQGVMDYWLIPRTVSGVLKMEKVVPVLQNNSGIFVHDIAEVKDYTVTPTGEWIPASDSTGNKP